MHNYVKNSIEEPFRLFFPFGVFSFLISILVWLPQTWLSEWYPVLIHRTFVLNGFISFFIAGFLMTAVPKFSKTNHARPMEIASFLCVTIVCLISSLFNNILLLNIASSLQAGILLYFLLSRVRKRKENVPFSFLFIFIGLILWFSSGIFSTIYDSSIFLNLHYEGAITAIILGVGTRLIPGIFGHIEIVGQQRKVYEPAKSILSSVPLSFIFIIILFLVSYFASDFPGAVLRSIIVLYIGIRYWKLFQRPKITSALTNSIWINCWCIVISFVLKAFWIDGLIHASHAFFISGILLLCLLIATRVLQAHGPGKIELENSKYLYVITFLIIFAASTRVTAYIIERLYYRHLGYSSILLTLAVLIWSFKYLKYVFVKNLNH